jgi:diguanylate cyclase (GGDEF)-like protein
LGLWASIREALDGLSHPDAERVMDTPSALPLLKVLAADSRKLSELLQGLLSTDTQPPHPWDGATPKEARPRLLLVDDDTATLTGLTELLSSEFEVIATDDSRRAADLIRTQPLDAVVSDLRMPGLDGFALLELLREDSLQQVPCVLVSAETALSEKLRALHSGAVDFLVKPLNPDELAARIHNAVAHGRELRREKLLQQTDDLTGLLNRRALRNAIQWAIRRAHESQAPLSLALIDQDGLKQINDTFGHPTGDAAIVAIAGALGHNRRTGDFAARLGGDEFALVMPDTDADGAERVLARVDEELAASPLVLPNGIELRLRVSHGVATLGPSDPNDWSALLSRADTLLYAAKRAKAAGGGSAAQSSASGA